MNEFQKKANDDQIVDQSYLNPFVQGDEYHSFFSKTADHLVTRVKDSKVQYHDGINILIYSY